MSTKPVISDGANAPRAVYVIDTGIIEKGHRPLVERLIEAPDLENLFKLWWGLDWKTGSYHRTTVEVNPSATFLNGSTHGLMPQYSQKALHLTNVNRHDRLYVPANEAHIESQVFAPPPIDRHAETPAAITKIGRGWFVFSGNVDPEEGTDQVVLRMLGLLMAE